MNNTDMCRLYVKAGLAYEGGRDYYYTVVGEKRFCVYCEKEITDWLNVHSCLN